MNSYLFRLMIIIGIFCFLAACASKRPVLYPNERLRLVGEAVALREIDECMRLAAEAGLESKPGEKVVRQTAAGAAVGAVVGTAAGAVTDNTGRGAGVGAAGGAAGGFMRGIFRSREPDPIKKRFVEECLRERGYKVIGWR